MERVTILALKEAVRVDADRLAGMYAQLGECSAEDAVCRAMEDLAVRLASAERLHRAGDWGGLAAAARGILPIATEIGMPLLGQVTRDVCSCLESGDAVALVATLARLLRVGERSLYAVWDLQDLSI